MGRENTQTHTKYKTATSGHFHLSPFQSFLSCLFPLSLTAAAGAPHYVVTWKTLFSVYDSYCGFFSPACLGTARCRMMDHYREYLPSKTATSLSPPILHHVGRERKRHQTNQHPENPKGKKKTFCQGLFCLGRMGSNLQLKGWKPKGENGGQKSLLLRLILFCSCVCTDSVVPLLHPLTVLHRVTNTEHSKDRALNLEGQVLSLSPSFHPW